MWIYILQICLLVHLFLVIAQLHLFLDVPVMDQILIFFPLFLSSGVDPNPVFSSLFFEAPGVDLNPDLFPVS